MNPIKIITQNHKILAEIDDYNSLIFQRKFNTYGEFQLKINKHKNGTEFLELGNLIYLSNNKAGIIKHKEISVDGGGRGTETVLVKGYTLDHIFSQRITLPPTALDCDVVQGNGETVIKHYIESNIINPLEKARKVDVLRLAPNLNRGKSIKWESRYQNLSKELEKITMGCDLGVRVTIDTHGLKWIVDVYEGRNLSVDQHKNSPVIFSHDFDNIKAQKYIVSSIGHKSTGYIGGKGEGKDRQLEILGGDNAGINRIETFVNASGSRDDLIQKGEQKLKELKQIKTLEGQVSKTGPFTYERDWDLGDIVTIQNKDWGVTMNARIIEVKEVYEASNIGLEVTFGSKVPTLMDKINQHFSQISSEITK
jgi:hypothetical protein